MGETRREELLRELDARLAATDVALAERYPGPAPGRHPVHTVYIPADRYDAGAVADWGEAGSAALAEHGGDDAELAAVLGIPVQLLGPVRARVAAKLHREPVEDLRVDFEDGYGRRADAEEDADATAAGAVLGAARAARAAGGPRPGPCARPDGPGTGTCRPRPAGCSAVRRAALQEPRGRHARPGRPHPRPVPGGLPRRGRRPRRPDRHLPQGQHTRAGGRAGRAVLRAGGRPRRGGGRAALRVAGGPTGRRRSPG